MLMIKTIELRNIHNIFQTNKIKHDITEISNSNKVIVPADKIRNLYKTQKEDYTFLFKNNTKKHKKLNRQ